MRTLVLCDDTWHPAAIARQGLEPLRQHGFDCEFLENCAEFSAERLNEFSLVVLAKANITSSALEFPWLTLESQMVFFDFIRSGGGLVVMHSGTSQYDQLPVMTDLIGGAFVSHPAQCAVKLEPQIGHALTVGSEPFAVQDEHYFVAMSHSRVDVFLYSRSEHGVQPAGWMRTEGIGRVCVLTPGHNLEVWLHPAFQKLVLNALRWAAKIN